MMMNHQELEQQIIHQLHELPIPLLNEVLHFTLFIKQQQLGTNSLPNRSTESSSQNAAIMLANLGGSDPKAEVAPRRQSELGS